MEFFADRKTAERSNAKNGGVSDALREKNESKKRNKIVGANKKTYIFYFVEAKKMAARKRFLAILTVFSRLLAPKKRQKQAILEPYSDLMRSQILYE